MVERARTGAPAGHALAMHLAECPHCAERWEAEVELSRDIRDVRFAASALRSAPESRARLLAEFDAQRRHNVMHRGFIWAMAAMTILLLLVAVQLRRAGRGAAPRIAQVELDRSTEDLLADAGFMPVPYAAPLAPGEYVEVVQRDLTPAALARMGFVIQTAYNNNEVTAELMVGEDGLPRAVRVPESIGIRY
jgi:predicted anti-sigma-YlaC factor YlaD